MTRKTLGTTCRLQAVTATQSEELPPSAMRAFEAAGQAMERPGAFDTHAIAVSSDAFRALTGFDPAGHEFITPEAVRRSAEAASPGRTQALGNARTHLRNEYIALGVFLRVCAIHRLGLQAETPPHGRD